MRAPNSTPIVKSWTGWNRLSVNCSNRQDLPTPVCVCVHIDKSMCECVCVCVCVSKEIDRAEWTVQGNNQQRPLFSNSIESNRQERDRFSRSCSSRLHGVVVVFMWRGQNHQRDRKIHSAARTHTHAIVCMSVWLGSPQKRIATVATISCHSCCVIACVCVCSSNNNKHSHDCLPVSPMMMYLNK